MSNFILHFFVKDTGACKTVIAAELSGVSLSLNEIKGHESGEHFDSVGVTVCMLTRVMQGPGGITNCRIGPHRITRFD